jgi:hypothetical protein
VREVRTPVQSAIHLAFAIGAWGMTNDPLPPTCSRTELARGVLGAPEMRINQGAFDLQGAGYGVQVGER